MIAEAKGNWKLEARNMKFGKFGLYAGTGVQKRKGVRAYYGWGLVRKRKI